MSDELNLTELESAAKAGVSSPHTILALIARVRELEASVPTWQPIETAPKDGTPILVFDPTMEGPRDASWLIPGASSPVPYDDPRFAIGYWRVWQTGGERMWGNRNSSECAPTHWLPLPQPPT